MMSEPTPVIELELYFARHGQSQGNVPRDASALTLAQAEDPDLTETGRSQAALLAQRIKQYKPDFILSSALVRAFRTAAFAAEQVGLPVEILPPLTEVGISEQYAGLSLEDLSRIYPRVSLAKGFECSAGLIVPSGRDDAAAYERGKAVAAYLRARFTKGEKVFIASHAAFNTFLFLALLGINYKGIHFDTNFCNTGLTKMIFYKIGTGPFGDDIRLSYCNDLSHLYADYPEYGKLY